MAEGGDRNDDIVEMLARESSATGSATVRLQVPIINEPSSNRPVYQKQANVMSKKVEWYQTRPDGKLIIGAVLLVLIFVLAIVISFVTRPLPTPPLLIKSTSPETKLYRFAGVAGDAGICSEVATAALARGGSAVDAALTALICNSVVHMQSSGVGGGVQMVIWDGPTQTPYTIDARETLPLGWSEDKLKENEGSLSRGPFSIGIPGEVAGYWEAHQRFGRLPWKSLFQPSIEMCQNGFKVTKALAQSFEGYTIVWLSRYSEPFYEKLRKFFINPQTGNIYQTGETIKCPELAKTLERIAENGVQEFYNGTLTDDIIADLSDFKAPISREDFQSYRAVWRKPLVNEVSPGIKMYSMRPPGNGAVLGYILNILNSFGFTPGDIEQPLTYHRVIEAIKFAYAKGILLGDEDFAPDKAEMERLIAEMASSTVAQKTRLWINDSATHPLSFYEPSVFDKPKDFGTCQISVLAADGSAVTLTASVNTIFGSGLIGKRTGIIFNNELDDFYASTKVSTVGTPPPTSANFPRPGKRPLSSACPTIFVATTSSADKSVRLVIGGAGGARITSAVAQVAARVLFFGENIKQAIEAPRFHHQRAPEKVIYESTAPEGLLTYLKEHGHKNFELTNIPLRTVVQAVQRLDNDSIIAVSDARKPAVHADGF